MTGKCGVELWNGCHSPDDRAVRIAGLAPSSRVVGRETLTMQSNDVGQMLVLAAVSDA